MKLKVFLPAKIFLDVDVQKVVAESVNGFFCLLPRHIDFVAGLVPGILSYLTLEGDEVFLAVDEGLLVKSGSEVRVSVGNAVQGSQLGELKEAVKRQFRERSEQDRKARSALDRLEAQLVRQFIRWEERVRV